MYIVGWIVPYVIFLPILIYADDVTPEKPVHIPPFHLFREGYFNTYRSILCSIYRYMYVGSVRGNAKLIGGRIGGERFDESIHVFRGVRRGFTPRCLLWPRYKRNAHLSVR